MTPRTAKAWAFLKHEAWEMGLISAYFFTSFLLIGVVKALFLLEYGVEWYGPTKALVGSLVVAKVVIVLDSTAVGAAFRSHVLIVGTALRAMLYTSFVSGVLVLEKVFHGYRATHELRAGVLHALEAAELSRAGATAICLFACFIGYCFLRELQRTVGGQRLRDFLLQPPVVAEKPDAVVGDSSHA